MEVFKVGLAEDGLFDPPEPEDDEDTVENEYVTGLYACICAYFYRNSIKDEKDTYLAIYQSILSLVPNFKKTIEDFGDDFEVVMELITLVSYVFDVITI